MYVWHTFLRSNFLEFGYFACYFDLDNWFLSWIGKPYNDTTSAYFLWVIIWINYLLQMYLQLVALTCNTLFCYDLIRSLRRPFENGKEMMRYYYAISFVVPFMILLIICLSHWR